jgi:GntR family transcriptional regulator
MASDRGRPILRREVERAILSRIANGRLEPGQRLPTCTAFASEMKVNKNTVSRAYQSLAEQGFVSTRPGKGTFVAPVPTDSARSRFLPQVEDSLLFVAQGAKLAGMSRSDFMAMAGAAAERSFGAGDPRLGYVDCVPQDATTLSAQLQQALGAPVAPLLLDDVLADPDRTLAGFDLVGVSMSHLGSVAAVRRPDHPELVGLLSLPDFQSLAMIVRLDAATRLAVICDEDATLRTLLPLLRAYNHDLDLEGTLTSDEEGLQDALGRADVLVMTVSAASHLTSQAKDIHIPVITVSFRLEPASIEDMATKVRQLTTGQVTSHGNHQ